MRGVRFLGFGSEMVRQHIHSPRWESRALRPGEGKPAVPRKRCSSREKTPPGRYRARPPPREVMKLKPRATSLKQHNSITHTTESAFSRRLPRRTIRKIARDARCGRGGAL